MKLLNEPISTWISIAAFLISFSTLILALRKQKHDERVFLASKVREIKALQGEMIRIIDEILEKGNSLEELMKKTIPTEEVKEYEMLNKDRSRWEKLKSNAESLYKKLGHEKLKTTDPVVLSAIAVESEDMKRELERARDDAETMMGHIEAIIKTKSKTRKIVNSKTPHTKQSKK